MTAQHVYQIPSVPILARMLIARLSSVEMQMAWRTIHYRPPSARGPGDPPYWPCVLRRKTDSRAIYSADCTRCGVPHPATFRHPTTPEL